MGRIEILKEARDHVVRSGIAKYFRLRYDGLRPDRKSHLVRVLSTVGGFRAFSIQLDQTGRVIDGGQV